MSAADAAPATFTHGLVAEWIEDPARWEELAPAWSDLVARDPDASIFQTPEWMIPWRRHLAAGCLRVLAVRRSDRLVALVSLIDHREAILGGRARVLAFVGEPEADRLGILADPGDPDALEAAAVGLADAAPAVDVVRLGEVCTGSPTDESLRRVAAARRIPAVRRVCSRAPVLFLEGSWEAIEARYPEALRTRLRRARRRQQETGGLAFRRWQSEPREVPSLLERFREIERRSWKGQRGVGIFSTPRRWDFFRELSLRLAQRGWLDVATLASGDRLVAYRYGFRFRGVFLDYNLAHDPADSRLSPGRVLLDEVVRDSHRLGLTAVDASRGSLASPHLLADWTTVSREHARWMLFGPSWRGRALGTLERRLKPVWRRVRGARVTDGEGPEGL